MTDGLQQSFPLSQSPLLIPLALEGHTGAPPQGCAKVAIAGERKNAFRERFTVTRRDGKAAAALLEDACDFTVSRADKDSGTAGGGDAVEFARHDERPLTLDLGSRGERLPRPEFPKAAPLADRASPENW